MVNVVVPDVIQEADVFEDQVFSVFRAIRDAGFSGQISGPEWTVLENGKEAALIIIDHVNSTTSMPWNIQFSLIREIEDDSITLYLRPFVGGEWRPVGLCLTQLQLMHAVEFETQKAMTIHSAPLRLYLDLVGGDEPLPENVAIFPIEKTFLEPPQ